MLWDTEWFYLGMLCFPALAGFYFFSLQYFRKKEELGITGFKSLISKAPWRFAVWAICALILVRSVAVLVIDIVPVLENLPLLPANILAILSVIGIFFYAGSNAKVV